MKKINIDIVFSTDQNLLEYIRSCFNNNVKVTLSENPLNGTCYSELVGEEKQIKQVFEDVHYDIDIIDFQEFLEDV